MAIITLTTDFGIKDHFAGAVKGALLSELSEVKVIDISHNISPFSILEAAYIIQNAFSSFPVGSIHIIGVDSEISEENKHIAVQLNDHFFICANNGIMSMICAEINPQKIVEINIHDKIASSFPVLDVFVKVAAHIARGGTLEVVGKLITKRFFESIQKGRRFEISARNHKFKRIFEHYSDIVDFNIPIESRNDEGQGLVVFNSSAYLEIAVYRSNLTTVGSASTLLGLNMMDTVSIDFLKD